MRVAFDAALAIAFLEAKKHLTDRGKVPPSRAELYKEFDPYAPASAVDDDEDEEGGDDPATGFIGR